jgi:hypothetical protein
MHRFMGRFCLPTVLTVGVIALAGCGGSSSSNSGNSGNSGTSSTSSNSGNTGSTTSSNSGNTGTSSNGGGATLTATQDFNQVLAAQKTVSAATAGLKTSPNDATVWQQIADATKAAAATINGLTGPSSMQSAQQQIATVLSTVSADATKVAGDLNNNDTAAAATDKNQASTDIASYTSAGQAFATAAQAAGATLTP